VVDDDGRSGPVTRRFSRDDTGGQAEPPMPVPPEDESALVWPPPNGPGEATSGEGTAGNGAEVQTEKTDVVEPTSRRGGSEAPASPEGFGPVPSPVRDGEVPRGWFDDVSVVGEATSPADRRERHLRTVIDTVVVLACALFVFLQLGPANLLADTTPAGGDMGAHVWGPAYLRDQLLPDGQVAGWASDWYAGFPAYQFYMVIPSLVIVGLDLGFEGAAAPIPVALGVGALAYAVLCWSDRNRRRWSLGAAAVAFACIGLPYGVAFKLVSVSGAVALPAAAYVFGRLSRLQFPTPAALAVATLPFLFYRGYNIYGGNLASLLAGEFAFSMSLAIGLVYLGVVLRGLETGRHRALAAGLLALTGLCHLIPAFWVLGASAVAVMVRFRRSLAPTVACVVPAALGAGLLVAGLILNGTPGLVLLALGALLVGTAAWLASESVRWLTPVLAVGGLLSSFWVVPFFLRRAYVNDMGWEKLPYPDESGTTDLSSWMEHLLPSAGPEKDLRWAFALAVVGMGLSLALRFRVGVFLTVVAVANGVAFWLLPQGRLWNARVLPFYYLVIILLAAFAVVEVVRLVAELVQARRTTDLVVSGGTLAVVVAVTFLYVGLPLGVVPESQRVEGGGFEWPRGSPWKLSTRPESFVKGWANWNYSGYERKPNYREYYDVVTTMKRLGDERGCGRSLWEYNHDRLDPYGTPMSLMLLPYWTDGCIGSMEGLFFESSSTTPFHFMIQTELSTDPSSAQRDMPYAGFNLDLGVQHLQLLGVRYYMATTDQAIQAADGHPDLTQVARSGPWVVYEVADSEVVTPLAHDPAVVEGIGPEQHDWLEEPRNSEDRYFGPSVQWFTDPSRWDVVLAADGPEAWQRVEVGEVPEPRRIPPAEVSEIDDSERDRISFDVDRVGSPVLVKASYFPNWRVDGARGPWRVAPNLMVVVPTENHVELYYDDTSVERLGYGLTIVGLVALVLLVRRGTYPFRRSPRSPVAARVGSVHDRAGPAEPDRPWSPPPLGDDPAPAAPGSADPARPDRPDGASVTGTGRPGFDEAVDDGSEQQARTQETGRSEPGASDPRDQEHDRSGEPPETR
jgi:hypothetical protein